MSKIPELISTALTAAASVVAAFIVDDLASIGAPELSVAAGACLIAVFAALRVCGIIYGSETLLKISFLGALVTALSALVYKAGLTYGWFEYFDDIDALLTLIRQYDPYAVLIFVTIQFAQVTVLPLPATLTTIAGITIFGVTEAVLYSSVAIIAGSMVAFALGRTFGVKLASWLCGAKAVSKYRRLLKGREAVLLYAMFLLPVFPDDLLCVIAGLGSMSYRSFLIMMIITRPIGVLWTAAVYKGAVSIPANAAGIALWIAIALVTAALFAVLYKYGDKIADRVNAILSKVLSKMPRKRRPVKKGMVRDDRIETHIAAVCANGRSLANTDGANIKPPESGS